MTLPISRRDAIRLGAALPLGYWMTASAVSTRQVFGANERLRVAGIGIGGKGASDIQQAAALMDVVAICDIDEDRLNGSAKRYAQAKKFFDYRKLFDVMMKEIDAVVVSTPDHSHALPSLLAIRAGKHVYCQKPLAHTPAEARMLRLEAAKAGVVTQMGNQGSGLSGLRRAVELVRSGILGDVKEAHVWTNRPFKYWKQSPDIVSRPQEAPVPAHVHWDEFLGAAAFRPYAVRQEAGKSKPAYHPHDWRGYWDFGTGSLGDMACHTANMAFRALELDAPISVKAKAATINPETYPAWAIITYSFPSRGSKVPVDLTWYEGADNGKRILPPDELLAKVLRPNEKAADSGSLLVGTKGMLYSPNDYGAQFRLYPVADFENIDTTKPEKGPMGVPAGQDPFMKAEWVEAIRAGKPEMASSSFEIAGRLTETMLLGNIAVRFAGTALAWDASSMTFPITPAANKLVTKEYRKGWELT
ncbi:Gfo/Idh/MocA family protein [Tuwongella immobilis]|uniref:Gfo/Idh/MocA-like oxidoreductase N-terminal domain-containing protein n=1 Tax=Tuwongella immobilis TaxID=692036 RepID=A0A6C2YLX4_9BACT|nr:Gfo/Idh/MocA family oxidoreductase [Tuwongella immobilis]VIP02229.1 nadh-dependent dehydrogenase : Putative dehydrogenase OS=Singulisphaera acidiphila (strain ATCC BAA-1392 / DSM 18658 / VKM B-2454 / MOB10) GN=Sinac_0026 PE=4 SV=1: GFO_IDH_MocA [Tuwongella immobilis]VTS00774.1 nadh-dependent dehydrogenase : Putative dehydrogenase OS=Singulisphaera acidiphila (strain ATCC BAA-1392 / DSM 18658 / VKM B-2454 / MOB10) GN=Sinac_0026 PE=4 SV=1: GFO_IDH_MocA [Tuwongella immobilis]